MDPVSLNNTLEKIVIKLVPMENLNGRKLVEDGDLCERRNGRGVDLNRNWSVDWGKKEKDYDPYEENPGTGPFSEPETQLMRKLSVTYEPHMWINVHSGMEALFMPYDHKNTTPDGLSSQRMKLMLKKLNYFHCQNRCMVGSGGGSVGYLAHGTATDYMFDIARVPMAFTFEIYGDGTASAKDCFKMFNPVDLTTFNRVINDWSAAFFTLFNMGARQVDELQPGNSSQWNKLISIDDYLNGYLMERKSRYGKKMEVVDLGWNPATFLHAYSCLPLAYATRQAAGAILQDVVESGVLFAILMCKHKVISLVGAQKASLHPDDMLLLANFVMSSESFQTSESFSPICLPRYNPMAFLYTYVHYLDVDTYLMLLTSNSDAFYHLKDWRIRIEMVLLKSNVLSEAQRSILDGGMHVEDLPVDPSPRSGSLSSHLGQLRPTTDSTGGFRKALVGGPAGLWHFIYRSNYLDQYLSSEFSSPINTSRQQKRLYRAYQKLYTSMHDRDIGPHKTQFRRDENYVLLCWVTQDFELFAAFDPLADKALAIKTCNRVCQWVKDVENEVFLLGANPFSW